MRRYPDDRTRGQQPCHVEACRSAKTRDTPLCLGHWRALPEALRREWLAIARRVVAAAESFAAACTGVTATYCPVHGDCTCQPGDDGTPSLDDGGCLLHDPLSDHAA